MEDRIKQFLESGKLEEYVFGILDTKEQEEVLEYIKQYPEINEEYLNLQNQLEELSVQQAIKAPTEMRKQIMESLADKNIPKAPIRLQWTKYAAIFGLFTTLLFAWAWNKSNNELQAEKTKYATLASACDEKEKEMQSQNELIAFLNSAQTQRFDLQGNQLAPDFKAMVFVNENIGKAILTPFNNVQLQPNKCLQLWGDLDGEMIPIAVLGDLGEKDYDLQINPQFTSLNLTIEEKTEDGEGQLHPDVSQLIASVVI